MVHSSHNSLYVSGVETVESAQLEVATADNVSQLLNQTNCIYLSFNCNRITS